MPDFSHVPSIGLHHPYIKQYLAIKNNTHTNPENLACIEGLRAFSRAHKAGLEMRSCFICPELLRGEESKNIAKHMIANGTPSFVVSAKTLAHLVDWEGPDGLVALVKLPHFSWQHVTLRTYNAILVLDGLQIPGNIGTIIRSADGAGADAIIITNRKQRLSHPRLVRASIGSLFSFPIIEAEVRQAIDWLRQQHFKIITTDTEAQTSYRQVSYEGRIAVVMGNEHSGISQQWYEAHDVSVSIPMNGSGDSLNVSNAAVLMLYEMLHQQGRLLRV
ncbi:MAG TPA: TrmH family RNA methyltransferase [Ktedonobacteraceae bacterium]|nr:TrmH family RNA methyltransferase [Ktedonobacteraceae bacterium]